MKLVPIKFVYVFLIVVGGLLISFFTFDVVKKRFKDKPAVDGGLKDRESVTDLNADPYVLDISGQNLSELPDFVWEKPNITHLILSGNKLSSLPKEIGRLTKVRVLKIDRNQLTELPSEIASMNLIELDASHNRLTSLPSQIRSLKSLDYLDLDQNSLTNIPDELFGLVDLEWINLSGNDIDTERIDQLKSALPFLIVDF